MRSLTSSPWRGTGNPGPATVLQFDQFVWSVYHGDCLVETGDHDHVVVGLALHRAPCPDVVVVRVGVHKQ
jgi:hypothetical protein